MDFSVIQKRLVKSQSGVSLHTYWAFGAVVIGSLFVWGFLWFLFLALPASIIPWVLGILLLLLWSVVVGMSFLIFDPLYLGYITYGAASLSPLVFFGGSGWVWVGVAVFFIFTVVAFRRVVEERELLVSFRFFRLMRRGVPMFFSGLAVLLAFVYHFSPIGAYAVPVQVPRMVVDAVFVPLDGLLESLVPGYYSGMTVGEFQSRVAPSLLGNLILSTLPQNISGQFTQRDLQELTSNFTISRDPDVLNQTIPAFTHQRLNEYIAASIEPFKELFSIFFLIGLAFVFKALSVPLMWLAIVLGWLMMKLFLLLHIFEMRLVVVNKEKLVLR